MHKKIIIFKTPGCAPGGFKFRPCFFNQFWYTVKSYDRKNKEDMPVSKRNKLKRIQNEHKKARDAIFATTTSNRVVDMLGGACNPLVAITLIAPDRITMNRSMGCIVERLYDGLRLVVSCRHAFQNYYNGYRLEPAMKNPGPIPLRYIGAPIEDPELESDVAFLLVRDKLDAPTQPLVIGSEDPRLDGMQVLYNAANRCDPLAGYYEVFVARQTVKERDEVGFCKLSVFSTEIISSDLTTRHLELEQEGWIRCRMLQMQSRPGNSGSPIWDEDLRLYGLDIRGTEPGTAQHRTRGDALVCLPVSQLWASRQRIEPQLRQLLASL